MGFCLSLNNFDSESSRHILSVVSFLRFESVGVTDVQSNSLQDKASAWRAKCVMIYDMFENFYSSL